MELQPTKEDLAKFWKDFDPLAATLKIMSAPPVYPTKLGADILRNTPGIKSREFRGTSSGVMLIVEYAFDPDHKYRITIDPVYDS